MNTHDLEQTLQISLQHLCVPVHADDALEFDLGLHTHHMVTMSSATHPRELLSLEISTFDVQPTDLTPHHLSLSHTHTCTAAMNSPKQASLTACVAISTTDVLRGKLSGTTRLGSGTTVWSPDSRLATAKLQRNRQRLWCVANVWCHDQH